MGASDVATTVSGSKVARAKEIGATTVVNYEKTDFEHVIQDVDFGFDTTGETKRVFATIRDGGCCVSIASLPSSESFVNYKPKPGCCLLCCLDFLTCCTRCSASCQNIGNIITASPCLSPPPLYADEV
jgi:hypothetical protein